MHQVFEDYFFSQGYFVADSVDEAGEVAERVVGFADEQAANRAEEGDAEQAAWTLVALGRYARIRITKHAELASVNMLEVAKRNIGFSVPLPFYRGFPSSVHELTPFALAFDQILHYFRTYGLGDFSEAGRSLFERHYERTVFGESVASRSYDIITREEAEAIITRMAEGFLASTRPLNDSNYQLLRTFVETHPAYPMKCCACKDTAVRLTIDVGNPDLACLIELPDVIRLVEWLLQLNYPGSNAGIRKLNLRNRDRKLLSAVIDRLLACANADTAACLEKKRAWNGLLHHIHYQPKCEKAKAFCLAMRTKDQRSVYSDMEKCLAAGDVRGAVDVLRAGKGPGAVLRHLDYLLSHCCDGKLGQQGQGHPLEGAADQVQQVQQTEGAADVAKRIDEDVAYVLNACETRNKIILVQLLLKHGARPYLPSGSGERIFTFMRLGKICKHCETEEERARRKTVLPADVEERVAAWLQAQLETVCHGTLGKVYVDEGLRNVALPLQEGASMGGFRTLSRGTRIPLPERKKVRAFTYWEEVDDIDLSCLALFDNGSVQEYSWRTMDGLQSEAITFSGDQTSGYHGGSEFFDVDLARFAEEVGAGCSYLVFCDNVFSRSTFDACICQAGYMLRDIEDSGEVFEPATVQTSFLVNCSSRSAFLFALDLRDPALIWLNLGEQSMRRIAGEGDVSFLRRYLHTVDIMSLHDFTCLLATDVVATPAEADVVFFDELPESFELSEGQELIRSSDTARILELLN